MELTELGASQQMLDAFGALMPLFKDKDLKLQPNPRHAKIRRKNAPKSPTEDEVDQDMEEVPTLPVLRLLKAMAQLVIRHDQEMQNLRRMDQFMLFLNHEPKGALHILLEETAAWKKQLEQAASTVQMPLRQHLVQALVKHLRARITQIVESKDTDALYLTSVEKGLILADRSFPFLRWDGHAKKLVLDKKQPISAPKLHQHLEELAEMLTDRELVIRFSCPSSSHGPEAHHPVEAPAQFEERQTIRIDVPFGTQLSVDGGRSLNEAALAIPDTTGEHDPATGGQTQGPRQGQDHSQLHADLTEAFLLQLTQAVSDMVLLNPDCWCYANSSVYCLLWTLLSHQCTSADNGGAQFDALVHFVQQATHKPVALIEMPWFQRIMQQWGVNQGQQDCAECTFHLLTWLQSDVFAMRWERRLATELGVQVMDHGTHFKPIGLVITHEMHNRGQGSLRLMVSDWHQELSMCQALLDAPIGLCLHVDRFHQNDLGTICKSQCSIDLECEVSMPIFTKTTLACEWINYVPVAGIAHLGEDGTGHYRAILKIQPTVDATGTPAAWLLTEDGQKPQPAWKPPSWFSENLMMVWLIRTDCMHLPMLPMTQLLGYQTLPPALDEPSDAEWLSLIQAQPGVDLSTAM